MERTKRGKLGGGDAAWEEKSGQKYATSEVRLAEITEQLCKDVTRGETQCHHHHGEWEELIEEWWAMDMEARPSMRQWLCVDKLKVCCEANHFGADCKPCEVMGSNGKLCSGNGKCKGGGTRKGNGKCSCSKEYDGEECDKCEKGYEMNTEHGCMDIDECIVSKPCTKDKFCVNTEGTFRCMACDKSCDGCDSDGPDNCAACAEGFQLNKNKVCVTDKAAEEEKLKEMLDTASDGNIPEEEAAAEPKEELW